MADIEKVVPPDPEELDFVRSNTVKLYRTGGINPLRWVRAKEEISFEDVVSELTGKTGQKISCPFHGPETIPSFHIYRHANDGYCWGCPPPSSSQYYDNVKFVSRYLDIKRTAALLWLEKKWGLPPMGDVDVEEEFTEIEVEISFDDLIDPYIFKASHDIQEFHDVELAEEYLQIYFDAVELLETSKNAKQEDPEEAIKFRTKAVTKLASVLGNVKVKSLLDEKGSRVRI